MRLPRDGSDGNEIKRQILKEKKLTKNFLAVDSERKRGKEADS
jgi:hypothetical protein